MREVMVRRVDGRRKGYAPVGRGGGCCVDLYGGVDNLF